MKLSIIIVNYNVKFFLEQCLHSVLRAVNAMEAEIIVVDNHSSDGSLEYLQPLFPSVQFLAAGHNLGFGKANNLALAKAAGEYVLFLNPDTLAAEDCFIKCIRFFNDHPCAGAIGVNMLDGSGNFLAESKRSFPTVARTFYKAIGLSALFPNSRIFNKYSLGYLDDNKNHPVDVLAGAFMMVRRSLLDKTGGFDERFFMYGEDIDLSYRLKLSGYENWYLAETTIIHFKGESLKKWSADHVKVFYQAMIIFVRKHYKSGAGFVLRPILIAGIKLRSLFSLFKGKMATNNKRPYVDAVLVGSKHDCDDCYTILCNEDKAGIVSARIEGTDVSQILYQLNSLFAEKKISMIVFCIGDLLYIHIISLIQKLPPGFSYRFHATGSKSIVGSDSSVGLGDVIALSR